jgi:hypothetical protein
MKEEKGVADRKHLVLRYWFFNTLTPGPSRGCDLGRQDVVTLILNTKS